MKNVFCLGAILKASFALLLLPGCGDGDFRINPAGGSLSELGRGGTIADNAFNFFQTNLFPIMTSTTNPGKSCLGSGCHSLNTSQPTFFQIDASSAVNTYNWAGARRTSVVQGTYAGSSSRTIQAQKDVSHPSDIGSSGGFTNWSTSEKALIDTWVTKSD